MLIYIHHTVNTRSGSYSKLIMVGTCNWSSSVRHQVLTYAPNNTKQHVLHGVISWRIRGPRMRWKPLNMASKDPPDVVASTGGNSLTGPTRDMAIWLQIIAFHPRHVWHGCLKNCILKEKTFPGFLEILSFCQGYCRFLHTLIVKLGPQTWWFVGHFDAVLCWGALSYLSGCFLGILIFIGPGIIHHVPQ